MPPTTMPKATPSANDADHRVGIYLAFIPWIVFSFFVQHSTLKLAAVGALLISVFIAARSIRAGAPKLIELGAALAFAGFTIVAFKADPATSQFVARHGRAIAAGILSMIAFSSLLVTPFTEHYARESVPRQNWSSPQFKRINRRLTTMWATVFAAMIPAHVIAGAIDTHRANLIFNWVIPVVLVASAVKRTTVLTETGEAQSPTDPGRQLQTDRGSKARTL